MPVHQAQSGDDGRREEGLWGSGAARRLYFAWPCLLRMRAFCFVWPCLLRKCIFYAWPCLLRTAAFVQESVAVAWVVLLLTAVHPAAVALSQAVQVPSATVGQPLPQPRVGRPHP